ncbi:heme/hemin ABC transporter substrate-binding protein [Acerihabitans arboris]|uniref:ABC transporter substrate-binding protein n=1 Tax=Acerihabitans arboris TaxID=2691583 RepID=A0A845SQM4_9GAMM|nr:hemin ABC transporter substrate-binding protein [Acerihabitans arboris]NDL65662.1 ABC transporter substrate-binding protein [Acerihabitans arboris]
MKRWLIMLLALPFSVLAQTRVVSIGGDVTEIVYALGAGSQLVARDSTSLHPAEANALPDVGYMRMLNAEGILAMRPTMVLASDRSKPSVALQQVADNGVRVVTVPGAPDIATIDSKITLIATALGRQAQGDALRADIRRQMAAIPATPLPVKVLFIFNHSGMTTMAAGQDTAADAAIRSAGLQNAMQGFKHYQPLSQEGVIGSAPDLVLITTDGVKTLGGEDKVWALPGLSLTPAGKAKRLLVLDDMALLGFGIETPAAIARLRQTAETLP